jgi:hypothetical protein
VLASYRPFLVSLVILAAILPVGAALGHWSRPLAAMAICCIGGGAYVLVIRLSKSGLTSGDRDALITSVPERARSHVVRLLNPVTVANA